MIHIIVINHIILTFAFVCISNHVSTKPAQCSHDPGVVGHGGVRSSYHRDLWRREDVSRPRVEENESS